MNHLDRSDNMTRVGQRGITLLLVAFLVVTSFLVAPSTVRATVHDGVAFLRSRQDGAGLVDGSVRSTDWATIGVSAAGTNPSTVGAPSLTDALANNPVSASSATELERRILAFRAAGQSAASEVDQLLKLATGGQIGSPDLLNDDAFGVLALVATNSGAAARTDAVHFIEAHQNSDGGFSSFVGGGSDVDSTGAALAALAASGGGSADVITRGFDYLASQQNADGGFGVKLGSGSNVDSTSWALWAYHTAGRTSGAARGWLAAQQRRDGSFGGVVSTAYALIALGDRPLPIVGSFTTPVPQPPPTPAPQPAPTPTPQPGLAPPTRPGPVSRPQPVAHSVSVSSSASVSAAGASATASGTTTTGGEIATQSTASVADTLLASQPASIAPQSESSTPMNSMARPNGQPREPSRAQKIVEIRSQIARSTHGQASPLASEQPSAAMLTAGQIDGQAARTERAATSESHLLIRRLVLGLMLTGILNIALISYGFGRLLLMSFTRARTHRF